MYNIAFKNLWKKNCYKKKLASYRWLVVSGASTSLTIAIIIYDETFCNAQEFIYNWKIFITFGCYTQDIPIFAVMIQIIIIIFFSRLYRGTYLPTYTYIVGT